VIVIIRTMSKGDTVRIAVDRMRVQGFGGCSVHTIARNRARVPPLRIARVTRNVDRGVSYSIKSMINQLDILVMLPAEADYAAHVRAL
jgi:hypothetical protein